MPTATPSASSSPDTRPRWPLTGKLLRDESRAHHAAVAVKVPDNRNEHPQRGIDEADIVFVELDGYRDAAGYSGTRLVPVFHSRLADSVAPVRSIRPVDIPLLSAIEALIGNTGAAPWVINYVKHYRAHLEGMLSYLNTKGTGSYGTMLAGVQLERQGLLRPGDHLPPEDPCPADQAIPFRAAAALLPFAVERRRGQRYPGQACGSIKIPYQGDGYLMSYRYDKKTQRYQRSMPWGPHVLANGTRVSTDNVLVIKAKQHYGKIFRGGGRAEPLQDIINASGRFYYLNRGRYVRGTWRKSAVSDPFEFTLDDGTPLKMAPGQTFVELPDTDALIRIKA